MKAVVLEAPGRFACIERAVPVAGEGEALLRIVCAGICASDLATIRGDNPIAVYPLTLGHESIGVVEQRTRRRRASRPATGSPSIRASAAAAARPAAPGASTTARPSRSSASAARTGCSASGSRSASGQLLPVPPALQGEHGALVEPSAVAVHVNRRGATRAGERVLIIGAGVIGILTAQVARACGAGEILLIDRLASRRAVLEQLGFERFLVAGGDALDEAGAGARPARSTSSTTPSAARRRLRSAPAALAPGGRLVLVAVPHGTAPLGMPFATIYRRELALIASRNYVPDDFREAIRLLEAGAIDPLPMVTGTWPLRDFATAHAELTTHPERHLKVLLRP